jgi:hypothetical protein
MRKALFVVAIIATCPLGVYGQNLQDQIDAVYRAQQQEEARQRAAYDAQQAELRRQRQEQSSAEKARIAASAALQRERDAALQADKQRNQAYEDQLRQFNIERQRAELDALKARTSRENDYVDADLARRSAETDVIKSQADRTRSEADANRNISAGIKNYFDQSGPAASRKTEAPSATKKTGPAGVSETRL